MVLRATTLVLAAVLALPAAAGSSEPRAHPCEPAGAQTVQKNRWVHVYLNEDYFACSYESRRTMELAFVYSSSSGFFDAFGFTLAGRFVAYTRVECSGSGQSSGQSSCEVDELRVVDMGRVKRTMRHPFRDGKKIGTIALKANGSIAYLAVRGDGRGNVASAELHRRDRRGRLMLAAGSGADAPGDLRLVGSTIHWRQSGREFTKTLK